MTVKISAFVFVAMILVLCSCDSTYYASYILNNTSNDTILISYRYHETPDTTITILPHEKKTFFIDFVIRKASSFGDCCPCNFKSLTTNDTTIEINSSSKWVLEKQNKDKHHDDGFVNCTFRK